MCKHTSFMLSKIKKCVILRVERICVQREEKEMEGLIESIREIEFGTIEELFENRAEIKEKFQELDKDTQRVYKWYFFYQLCLLDYSLKSLMWDYLCDINGAELQLRLAYMDFKRKQAKYHLKYLLEEEKAKELE